MEQFKPNLVFMTYNLGKNHYGGKTTPFVMGRGGGVFDKNVKTIKFTRSLR